MKKIGLFLCTFVATTALGAVSDKELKLSSPNGNQTVVFRQEQVVPDTRELCYQVTYKGIPVVEKSRAGLGLDNRIWEMALGVVT